MTKQIGPLLLGIAVLVLGTLPLILKILVQQLDPITLTWFRFTGAALILAGASGRELFRDLRTNATRRGVLLTLTTASGLTGNYVFFVMGLQYLSPSTTHIVLQVVPFLVLAGGILIYHEPFDLRLVWGVFLLAIGSLLFFNQRLDEARWGTDFVLGVGIALVSAVSWAVFFLMQKALHPTMRSRTILFCCCAAGSIALTPIASHDAITLLDQRLFVFLLLSTAATAISYTALSYAMRHIATTTTGLTIATIPLITVFAMMLLANRIDGLTPENLNALAILGAVLVVIGLMVGTSQDLGTARIVNETDSHTQERGF